MIIFYDIIENKVHWNSKQKIKVLLSITVQKEIEKLKGTLI